MTNSYEWGQTPWDNLSKEELIRELLKNHTTLRQCVSILHIQKHFQGSPSSYWTSKRGVGYQTLAKAEECFESVHDYGDLFRVLLRYIDDLLFTNKDLHDGWYMCPNGHLIGGSAGWDSQETGEVKRVENCILCGEPTRPISWADFNRPEVPEKV